MAFVTYFFGSGLAFFVGAALMFLALAFKVQTRWRRLRRLAPLATVLGVTLVTLSATPLPYWLYAVLGFVTLFWLFTDRWLEKRAPAGSGPLRVAVCLAWSAAVALEAPYHCTPQPMRVQVGVLWVIADSVTAGVGDPKVETWPSLLSARRQIAVRDMSQSGATLRSALRVVDSNPVSDGLVLLEIGGNDMLGSTTDDEFEQRLEALLEKVVKKGQVVVMFELPLPPFRNALGMIQRRLAAKHGVLLIPKRLFVGLLTTDGATIDGIHLTQDGQSRMAELIWEVVKPAFGG